MHPAAPHHLPFFIPGADGSDPLMVVTGLFLVGTLLWVGTLYWKLHSLPERMAHRTHKLQFEIVAVLCLISLFTHMHIFWIAGLLLALIDLPDFGTPLNRIAGSAEKMAGLKPGEGATKLAYDEHFNVEQAETTTDMSTEGSAEVKRDAGAAASPTKLPTKAEGRTGSKKERSHA